MLLLYVYHILSFQASQRTRLSISRHLQLSPSIQAQCQLLLLPLLQLVRRKRSAILVCLYFGSQLFHSLLTLDISSRFLLHTTDLNMISHARNAVANSVIAKLTKEDPYGDAEFQNAVRHHVVAFSHRSHVCLLMLDKLMEAYNSSFKNWTLPTSFLCHKFTYRVLRQFPLFILTNHFIVWNKMLIDSPSGHLLQLLHPVWSWLRPLPLFSLWVLAQVTCQLNHSLYFARISSSLT